jgi:hypothetical protein
MRKPGEKRPLGRLSINGRIILKWILDKKSGKVWNGFIWLRMLTL